MRCPSCGANVNGAFCEYCGSKLPAEQVETQSIHGQNVVVNNYYYSTQEQARTAAGGNAPSVRSPANSSSTVSPKSKVITFALCLCLGFLGAHRFYAGRYLMGVVYLFTVGLFGFGWLVDLILILVNKMRDGDGLYIVN